MFPRSYSNMLEGHGKSQTKFLKSSFFFVSIKSAIVKNLQ